MIRKIFCNLCIGLIGISILGCAEGNFSGDSAKSGNGKAVKKPSLGTPTNQTIDTSKPTTGGDNNGLGSDSGGSKLSKECTINLNYDPKSISCSIPVTQANAIWNHVDGWKTSSQSFQTFDVGAHWISPLAPTSDDGKQLCPQVNRDQKLIYVSYFDASSDGVYSISALNDNDGTLRLWKDSDPAKEIIVVSTASAYAVYRPNLKQGRYSLIVDSRDSGVASAIILSVKDPAGNVIKRTTNAAANDWCIFQVPATQDTKTYVPQAAACRTCFGRP